MRAAFLFKNQFLRDKKPEEPKKRFYVLKLRRREEIKTARSAG
jgi:hypothetical protein